MTKLERRKVRIEAERVKEIERKAFYDSQPKGCDNPIRFDQIPYNNLFESKYD